MKKIDKSQQLIMISADQKDIVVNAMAATGLPYPEPYISPGNVFLARGADGPVLAAALAAGAWHLHKSDCALHGGPAWRPEPCSCGVNPGQVPTPEYCEWEFETVDGVLVPVSDEVWNRRVG